MKNDPHELTMQGPGNGPAVRPDLQAVRTAVRSLDAWRRTTILLKVGDAGPQLVIGGGGGDYVVSFTEDESDFWNLIAPEAAGTVELTCGQTAEFPARQVVTLEAALAAAQFFVERGERNPSLLWEPATFVGT